MSDIYFNGCVKHIETGVKPCPLCGKVDALAISTEEHFDSVKKAIEKECGRKDGGIVTLDCVRCDLRLHNHKDGTYQDMCEALIAKWNERSEENETANDHK